jgi:hypothetical protein
MSEKYDKHTIPGYDEIQKASVEFGEKLVQTASKRLAAEAKAALEELNYCENEQ